MTPHVSGTTLDAQVPSRVTLCPQSACKITSSPHNALFCVKTNLCTAPTDAQRSCKSVRHCQSAELLQGRGVTVANELDSHVEGHCRLNKDLCIGSACRHGCCRLTQLCVVAVRAGTLCCRGARDAGGLVPAQAFPRGLVHCARGRAGTAVPLILVKGMDRWKSSSLQLSKHHQ